MFKQRNAISGSPTSTWSDRLVLLFLALAGLGIASYLACYQMGLIAKIWDPFFGEGSNRVLHSKISQLLPVPDAVLGALGYALELILGLIGGKERWRTLPWAAVLFGLLAMGMAVAGVILIICQPLIAHAWCTLCLCSAAISFVVVAIALREFMAALAYLRSRRPGPQSSKMGNGARCRA